MNKQRLLFENLKNIKDYWVRAGIEHLNPNSDLKCSDIEEAYKLLQSKIISNNEKDAYEKVLNEIVEGAIHSILVMIDGGDPLADNYLVDLIDQESKESLKENIALHEEFFGYLLDVEE